MNSVNLIGRLTKAVELKKTTTGKDVCSFTLAVNRQTKKETQQDADFISCIAWNNTAKLMHQYLHKGSLIGLEGRIQTRSYENQQNQKVYVTEVVAESVQFLEPKSTTEAKVEVNGMNVSENQNQSYNVSQGPVYAQSLTEQAEQMSYSGIDSNDLPF